MAEQDTLVSVRQLLVFPGVLWLVTALHEERRFAFDWREDVVVTEKVEGSSFVSC